MFVVPYPLFQFFYFCVQFRVSVLDCFVEVFFVPFAHFVAVGFRCHMVGVAERGGSPHISVFRVRAVGLVFWGLVFAVFYYYC